MFSWFKKKSNKKVRYTVDDYSQNIPIQYKMVDLDISMENIKAYYYDLNEENKKCLIEFIRMAEYMRDWVCAKTNISNNDITISHVFKMDTICLPDVTLSIKLSNSSSFHLIMGYNDHYKRNCTELANFVYKQQAIEKEEAETKLKEIMQKFKGKNDA
jgi:hypothetical protein